MESELRMGGWNEFQGLNAGYVLELYDRYRQDPTAVEAQTRAYCEQWTPPDQPSDGSPGQVGSADVRAVVGAATLVESIRRYGHLAAQIDPLGSRPTGDPSLAPEGHGITEEQLRHLPASVVSGPLAEGQPNAAAALAALRQAYCTRTGYDFAQVFVPEEREWLRLAVETGRFRPPMAPVDAEALLDRITEVETFERFLHRTFPGKTRFSVEGLDMLVPILDTVIDGANDAGLQHVLIGMAHRGRLNVLAHVLGKPLRRPGTSTRPLQQELGAEIETAPVDLARQRVERGRRDFGQDPLLRFRRGAFAGDAIPADACLCQSRAPDSVQHDLGIGNHCGETARRRADPDRAAHDPAAIRATGQHETGAPARAGLRGNRDQ